ncbi:hypothetical protein BaRGS_00019225 [Batillaria attramentaria]|uniref:Uncharacterized protein n=1 Tax=Batillaria attramentaria TaxID=370345 RepID=A0ABD0KRK1_9CAEN
MEFVFSRFPMIQARMRINYFECRVDENNYNYGVSYMPLIHYCRDHQKIAHGDGNLPYAICNDILTEFSESCDLKFDNTCGAKSRSLLATQMPGLPFLNGCG